MRVTRRQFAATVCGCGVASAVGGAATAGLLTDGGTGRATFGADRFKRRFAVNVGGGQYTTADGRTFAADRPPDGGSSTVSGTTDTISGTPDDPLFDSIRYGGRFRYDFDVGSGVYDVVLYFAETYWGKQGRQGDGVRRFDVNVEGGTEEVSNLDIHAEVGSNTALTRRVEYVDPGDGTISVQFTTDRDNALVSAIEVLPAGEYLNCGGPAVYDTRGQRYVDDSQYVNTTNTYSVGDPIADTDDDELYRSERYGNPVTYDVPVPDGTYDVVLRFAEIFWEQDGQRVFDVTVEGRQALTDFDIHAEVGADTALVKRVPNVAVTDGSVTIDTTVSVDNAKFSAIDIVPR